MKWAYGVSTTPGRRDDLLPQTLSSLARAGFDRPRLFVDGCDDPESYRHFGLPMTVRSPGPDGRGAGNFGNWWAAAVELFSAAETRCADRFLIFEDDILCCRNLKQFLEQCELPAGYWNLFTFPQNERLAKKRGDCGWFEAVREMNDFPWPVSRGLGAQGLMFDRETLDKLIRSQIMSKHLQGKRFDRRIDGAISNALGSLKIFEQCHYPSLMQHVGRFTTIPGNPQQPPAASFPGEDFDCMELLNVPTA